MSIVQRQNDSDDSFNLSKLLAQKSETQVRVEKALKLLQFDRDFTYVCALVTQLYEDFKYFNDHSEDDNFVAEWAAIWSEAKDQIDPSRNSFSDAKVPVKGQSTTYPLLTTFGRDIPVNCEFIRCIRVLFFKALWDGDIKPKSTHSTEIARQLRLSTVPQGPRCKFVQSIKHTKTAKFGDYFEKVGAHLKKQLDSGHLSTKEELLVVSLSTILKFAPPKKSSKPKQPSFSDRNKPSRVKIKLEREEFGNDNPIEGFFIQSVRPTESENLFDIPDQSFEANIDTTGKDLEQNDIANMNRSLRWIHNMRSVGPSSTRRLNRLERARLVNLIRELSISEPEIALIFYLLYLLGLNIDSIWSLRFGDNLDISRKGYFLRKLPTMEQAYVPDEQDLHFFHGRATQISLKLPNELTKLISVLPVQNDSLLADSLKLNRHQAKRRIQDILETCRQQGNPRFHYKRLNAALSTELTILFNDTLITHLLSGSKIHMSPTQRYYRASEISHLQSCWLKVTTSLLSTKIGR